MPQKHEHVQKAEGNVQFALSINLDSQTKVDWALVALFYAALHYIEAYLADGGVHLRNHGTRDGVIGRDTNLKKIFREYSRLKYYGSNARYEVFNFTAKDVTAEAEPRLRVIETLVKGLI